MLQAAHPMYVMPRVLLMFVLAVTAFGQTNGPVNRAATPFAFEGDTNNELTNLVFTNYTWNATLMDRFPPISLLGTNFVVRPISLNEAVQMAIQNNYAVQIVRRNPDIARFALEGSYGIYEPSLGVGARHSSSAN